MPSAATSVKAIAATDPVTRSRAWHRSDAVTSDRAIAFRPPKSRRSQMPDRPACSLPASTASSRDYVWSPKRSQAKRRRIHGSDRQLGQPPAHERSGSQQSRAHCWSHSWRVRAEAPAPESSFARKEQRNRSSAGMVRWFVGS
jgi:hypothetical protein